MTNSASGTLLGKLLFLLAAIAALLTAPSALAVTQVFAYPPNPAGGHYKSAWYPPDGLDGDEYSFESFTIAAGAAITEVRWRGAYTNYLSGAGRAPVSAFTIAIYRSIAGDSQPDLGTGGRLVRYTVSGNAGETQVGTLGGVIMYDYAFTLPAPFQAAPGTVYWVQIEASQGVTPTYSWPPDWSLAAGTGGNNSHFRRITGGPTQTIGGDLSFSLYTSDAPTVSIVTNVAPAGTGSVTGAGSYPINSTVTLNASPNAGWGFANWTVADSAVSTNSHYTFTATANRTLSANFVPAYTIITSAYPAYAGTITGGGVYNEGATVTLAAMPAHGFVFTGWSDGSTVTPHSFPASSDVQITGFFGPDPRSVTFDFDNARQYAPLPIDLTVSGLSAHFSATGGGFSVQRAGELGISPPGFSGLDLMPSSVFAADLIVDFSETVLDFSILYSPQELGCDNSATMRATAYMNGAFAGTNTATCPVPGTWPSGTLSVAVPTGFNRVVVHYDARPPTCQDYGVIFLADNVTVTRACAPPSVSVQPVPQIGCLAGAATFAVAASGSGTLAYQWRKDTFPLDSLVNPSAATDTLVLSGLALTDAGLYDCLVAGDCASMTSDPAALSVCAADFNCDGNVNSDDLGDFITCYFFEPPCSKADFNADTMVNPDDLGDFITTYFGPAC